MDSCTNQNIFVQTQEEELLSIMALFGEATPAQWTGLIWVQSITHPHVSSSIYLYIIAIIARGCNRFGPGTQDSVPGHPVLSTRVPSTRTLVTMPNLIQWAFCCNSKLASIGNTELSRQITKTTKKSSPPLLTSPRPLLTVDLLYRLLTNFLTQVFPSLDQALARVCSCGGIGYIERVR